MILPKGVYFVSGIDTDAGKSYATGLLARMILDESAQEGSVITQKLVQTGCPAGQQSEDILLHRKLMGIPLQAVDIDGVTCTERFEFPASPHLAAALEGRTVDLARASAATAALARQYDIVLVEGAGGLMVPLGPMGPCGAGDPQLLTLDYIHQHELPLLFVTSAKLGSLSHTLLSLEACRARGIDLEGVLWNRYPPGDARIAADTHTYIEHYLQHHYPAARMIEVPIV